MKLRQMLPQRKLKATAARPATHRKNASTGAAGYAEEEEEPTMRLSTAFVVVVLLHIVAIGGIYTFEAVKVKGGDKTVEVAEEGAAAGLVEKVAPVSPAAALATANTNAGNAVSPVANTETTGKSVAKTAPVTTPAVAKTTAPAATKDAGLKASGTVHTVAKGENPVAIAKKYSVDYEALLSLNNIDDPRRLRIGQKLQIPTK